MLDLGITQGRIELGPSVGVPMDLRFPVGPEEVQIEIGKEDSLTPVRLQKAGVAGTVYVRSVCHAVKGAGMPVAVGNAGGVVAGGNAQHVLVGAAAQLSEAVDFNGSGICLAQLSTSSSASVISLQLETS